MNDLTKQAEEYVTLLGLNPDALEVDMKGFTKNLSVIKLLADFAELMCKEQHELFNTKIQERIDHYEKGIKRLPFEERAKIRAFRRVIIELEKITHDQT